MIMANRGWLGEGGARGLGKLARAVEARNPGFLSRCRAGMLGLHTFEDWGPGTFGSSEGSALEHFRKHGGDAGVRAKNLADYLRKASDALEAARGKKRGKLIPGGTKDVYEYPGTNPKQFIH